MTAFWPSIEDQLDELNDRATSLLEELTPAPDGLPPKGSWIRAATIDDDARGKPASPWHCVVGWNGRSGCLATRCRGNQGRQAWQLSEAVQHYVGNPPRWWASSRHRLVLLVEAERPEVDVCRQCDARLIRDAERAVAAARAAEQETLVELLPAIGAIATDALLNDGERGRRLRELWPINRS